MKALVYRKPGLKEWTDKEKPAIQQPTDATVRITRTTICGTDLRIGMLILNHRALPARPHL